MRNQSWIMHIVSIVNQCDFLLMIYKFFLKVCYMFRRLLDKSSQCNATLNSSTICIHFLKLTCHLKKERGGRWGNVKIFSCIMFHLNLTKGLQKDGEQYKKYLDREIHVEDRNKPNRDILYPSKFIELSEPKKKKKKTSQLKESEEYIKPQSLEFSS